MVSNNYILRVRLTAEESKTIKKKAQEMGLKPSAFLRLLGLRVVLKAEYEP